MSFRVVWSPRAKQAMRTHLFLARETGRDPRLLKQAIRDLGDLLSREAETAGESRDGNDRLVFVGELIALYEVFPAHGVALIYRAKVR